MKKSVTHKTTTHKQKILEKEATQQKTSRQRPSRKKLIITIIIIAVLALGLFWLLASRKGATMDKEILAKVNGEPLYASDVEKILNQTKQQGFPLTQEQVLEQLIARKVLLQEAKKQKIKVEEASIDKYISDLEKAIGQSIEPLLQNMSITEGEFREQVREQLTITQALAEKMQATTITDEEIEAFYEANEDDLTVPEQVNASHILVKTEEEAKAILKELEKGKNFGTLAREKSIDPSAKTNSGNLGFFSKGQMVPEFETAAFALDEDELSEPTKSQFGYHIIKLHEKREAGKLTLQETKEDIRKVLQEQKTKENVDVYVKALISKAKVERFTTEEKG
ncbi:peptidylprolyl isomerase [Candidatus Woesearchaeota archaeon]|nr:peptidylprolyl isomerase [Candidatus Woesearchaeota archaeon]